MRDWSFGGSPHQPIECQSAFIRSCVASRILRLAIAVPRSITHDRPDADRDSNEPDHESERRSSGLSQRSATRPAFV